MAIKIVKDTDGAYKVEETIYVNADRSKVVAEDSPEAAWQYATKGKRIPMADAVRLGLVKLEEKAVAAPPEDKAVKAAPENKKKGK